MSFVTHAIYQVNVTETEFEVRVIGHTDKHPLNWCMVNGLPLETVRQMAAQQVLPVIFTDENGNRHDHGTQFTTDAFERAAYSGYVSYGCSMTDGYYAPLSFDAWVISFRKFTVENLRNGNDFTPTAVALTAYLNR